MNNPGILPYRSGYEAGDRKLDRDRRRVATSALELGIDIAEMEIGANPGVPQSRKALRQRIGRVGRSCPGAFKYGNRSLALLGRLSRDRSISARDVDATHSNSPHNRNRPSQANRRYRYL